MTSECVSELKLGLIGVGIGRSRAPDLHRLAGHLCGVSVTYDLIQPDSGKPELFDDSLLACRARGYRGLNVTHPFKERAAEVVQIASEHVRRIGALNTVRLDLAGEPRGFNSDYTGFKRAFMSRFAGGAPGAVAIVGAGGVGRAIAFGLVDVGAEEIRLFDQDASKAKALGGALQPHTETRILICGTVEEATTDVVGLINATPVGMYGHPGTPIPTALIGKQSWAFDAVYTPIETAFLMDAANSGLEVLSGYELFFYQGVDAFEFFTGIRVDEARLRQALARPEKGVHPVGF